MCESKADSLVELLHSMMQALYHKVGDDEKAKLLENWRLFYDVWTESEADNG